MTWTMRSPRARAQRNSSPFCGSAPGNQDHRTRPRRRRSARPAQQPRGAYVASILYHGLGPEPVDQVGNRAFYESLWAGFPRQSNHHRRHSRRGRPDGGALQADRGHRGTFMGVPPTGRALILNGQTVVRVRDSRVVERSTTSDLLGLLIQLGAIPAPGGGVRHRSRVPVGPAAVRRPAARSEPALGLNPGRRGGRDRMRGRASSAPPCARRRPRTRAPPPGRGRQGRPPPS